MNLTIALEHRFLRSPTGEVFCETGLDTSFWDAYFEVFDRVCVVARVRNVQEVPGSLERVDGPRVKFLAIPYYLGLSQYALHYWTIRRIAAAAARREGACILRMPSPVGALIAAERRAVALPYAVEVVGDPYDVFAPGVLRHPLREGIRRYATEQLRRTCHQACAASYVTRSKLQQRYPSAGPMFAISSIRLDPGSVRPAPRTYLSPASKLVFVGSLAQLYKGPDLLISATAELVAQGENLSLTIVGDGRYRAQLESMPGARFLQGRLALLGWLPPGKAVRDELDQADVFILPSRTEGLPRAMVEAMARGLPCLGAAVGGIPELLDQEDMVPPGDEVALAAGIRSLINDPSRLTATSRRNLARSHQYNSSVLGPRRQEFYSLVRSES
jgi:glycosyltransferase involved in cell wall biosynthesis